MRYPKITLPFIILSVTLLLLTFVNGFSQSCSFSVTTHPEHVKCHGMATGSITLSISPSGDYGYLWSTGETSATIQNLEAATYFVKVSDKTGCESIHFITIDEPPALTTTENVSHPVCYNENSGSIEIFVSGGVSPYSYSWNNNIETASNKDLYSGNYECIITDANFCTKTNSYELVQPDKITTIAEIYSVRGYGLSDGSINISCSGGVHPYQYNWSNGEGYTASTEDIYNIPSADYSLQITDSKNCTYDTSIFISQPPLLEMGSSVITNVFCNAFSDGAIDVTIKGGVPPYKYIWANTEIILTEDSPNISNLAMGDYYLEVIDNNGITLRDSFYVDEPNSIVASIQTTEAFCFDSLNGSAKLTVSGGVPPFSFLWSNGKTTQDIENVHAGTYEVEIVDSKGCFRRVSTEIDQPDSIEINTSVVHLTCKDHHNGQVLTDVTGGIPPYIYQWSNGETGYYIENLDMGTYSVSVTDDHGCPMTDSETVLRPVNGCIEIPNAFTPNGDNINDTWVIKNSYLYSEIEVIIFNNEGYPVFEGNGYEEEWDGKFNNNDVASGTYYYIVNLHNGDPVYKGIVTIVR